jgi:selenide,water dikinase
MGPEALAQVLRPLREIFEPSAYPDLLQGLEAPDDAAVYRLDAERAVVLTADFFPPVVDDPYHYGAVAAANALSDLYAMGADPLFAINLVGFPEDLDPAILSEILRGGADKVREAGAVIAGGHTTVDNEPKYGLAAVGLVHPGRVLTKGGARPGDALLLTKPLGTGVITTAHKRGKVDAEDLDAAVGSMMRLSRLASRILRSRQGQVHALTDITGFSLLGHGHEMAHASGVALRFRFADLPFLPGAERYAAEGNVAGGLRRNESYYGPWTTAAVEPSPGTRSLLFDPQTSGGLLAAVDPGAADLVLREFRKENEPVWRVGEVIEGEAGRIEVV